MTARLGRLPWDLIFIGLLALYPLIPGLGPALDRALAVNLGSRLAELAIFCVLALGLNVVVGYTGLLHLGIGAFFGIGAYTAGVLLAPSYPFQVNFFVALAASTVLAAGVGVLLGAPTLRLRGDYLALVTLGFGEVMRFALRNLEQITNGAMGLSPLPPPSGPGLSGLNWAGDYRPFFYLSLGALFVVLLLLRNLEHSRLGRAWVALREDEIATECMGLSPARLKLAAFALGAGLAGLAGCLYAVKLSTTADPDAYGFNRSIIILCCLILGGLGNRAGVLLGVFLVLGFDNILAPALDAYAQRHRAPGEGVKDWQTFTFWRMALFGLTLILVMRFRPEGLLPSRRVRAELHTEKKDVPDADDTAEG